MRICWIGLGNMGLPMATRLHNARFDVVGFDLAAKARAVAVDTRDIAGQIVAAGRRLLDTPVSGGTAVTQAN